MRSATLLLQMILFASTAATAQDLTLIWKIENVFSMPESATFDTNAQYIFVSNVNEYAKDGNGFISRVSVDDASVVLHWLDGLDSPTGLAVFDGLLYFADFDSLVVADIATAQILNRYAAPDINPSLNDVAISPEGNVFVTGSASSSIYHLDEDQLKVWRHDEELLSLANGLAIEGDLLIHGGQSWNVFNRHTAELASDAIQLAPNLEGIDGITRTLCGSYLLSLLADDRLWHVSGTGNSRPLIGGPLNGIDLHSQAALVVVPQVGGDLTLLRQDRDSCAR